MGSSLRFTRVLVLMMVVMLIVGHGAVSAADMEEFKGRESADGGEKSEINYQTTGSGGYDRYGKEQGGYGQKEQGGYDRYGKKGKY
ncbi:hypothetical protein KP509_13G030100 [Ceratopteris richardii]|uniref:Glycine-rich protein n=1 Tax=Ceratopteris richardii TaxID=49495 RepID=A0A8T2TJX1_CERRI|nr:hypothetical protein KP509_13G030100 [Ceratopteris richardii]